MVNKMRLWSISPEYLDAKGLVANWREGLLARKVLLGNTVGYKNHPQLIRFRELSDPISGIDGYLGFILREGHSRGYRFDGSKINKICAGGVMKVAEGQIRYEFSHLLSKLKIRDTIKHDMLSGTKDIKVNGFFTVVPGAKEPWER